ncbi:MAG: hypothetical protein A2138_14735 [Deltaproteobacteria bacterium RBG_16_71_12]|nr:MAG: hypothetical protein A2138_14735 [Deltaproteobacteria bacterium RBG_16_71_12]
MDVALPIASVIPSLDGPVLAALSTTTAPLTLTRAHRLAGRGSLQGVRRVLHRLVETGLVLEVPGGFVLNRDHLAAPAIAQLASLHGELAQRVRATVGAWPGKLVLVGLFGSAARRDGAEGSDIDVLLVSDDQDAPAFADELADRIRRWTGNSAQVIALSRAELSRLRRARAPIVQSWQSDVVVIAGDKAVLTGKR